MLTINDSFTISDIHAIRYDNFESTKELTKEELIHRTKKNAVYGWFKIEQFRKAILLEDETDN